MNCDAIFVVVLGYIDAVLVVSRGGPAGFRSTGELLRQVAEEAASAQALSPDSPVAVGRIGVLMGEKNPSMCAILP